MELALGAEVDRYRVEGVLGRGGMAAVYRVRHTRLDTEHALKVLALTHPALRTRLLAEGRVQARISDPHVVAVSDVLEVGGQPALLMELVRGPSLDQALGEGPLPLALVDALVPHVLAGVAAAHAHGVVHRDLKPANVLLHVRPDGIVAKVGDFGLVKSEADQGATRTGTTMGTPAYMSPEQVRSTRDVDARADVFALGAVLYELVLGRRAFDGESAWDVQQAIVNEAYPRPPDWDALPERVRRTIAGALRADRDARLPTVAAVWESWSPDGEPLEVAAARPVPLEGSLLRAVDAWRAASPSRADDGAGTWADSAASPAAPALPVAPPPAPSVARTGWLAGAVVGASGLALGAVLAVGAVAGGLAWWTWGGSEPERAPDPALRPADMPPDPAAAEPADPDPAAAEPAAPDPEAPEPAPPDPAPPPGPAPDPRPAPRPKDPAPPASARVTVSGDVKVRLTPKSGGASVEPPAEVPPGEWRLEAWFGGKWQSEGVLVLAPGEVRAVACSVGANRCRF